MNNLNNLFEPPSCATLTLRCVMPAAVSVFNGAGAQAMRRSLLRVKLRDARPCEHLRDSRER